MIFNFARKRKRKKSGEKALDATGAPVAFGRVYSALSDMEVGGRGILGEFDMPEHVAEQLMNLGFVPGLEVIVAQSGPGGDPRVYRVDGVEVALRGELAKLIAVATAVQTSAEGTSTALVADAVRRPTSAKGRQIWGTLAVSHEATTPARRPGATQALSTQEASAD